MGGRAQRLPPKRTQKGRRSVCDLFSWFVFVVVALCFCSSLFFFFCLSFWILYIDQFLSAGGAQRLSPKRTQKGRRSVCDLFSLFVFVVVALCFCSSPLMCFFVSFLLDTLYRSISLGWRGGMWGRAQRLPPKRTQKGRRSVYLVCVCGCCCLASFDSRCCILLVLTAEFFLQAAPPPKRTQRGRRSVCCLFSWFVIVVVALCFCSSSLYLFFHVFSVFPFRDLYRSISHGWRGA